MIIIGDIALPYKSIITLKKLPVEIKEKLWIGNLEGSLIKDGKSRLNGNIVFNDFDAVKTLRETIPFQAFSIANNHIVDAAGIETTLNNLDLIGVKHVGAGRNSEVASRCLNLTDNDGKEYSILSFGWDCIKCIYATKNNGGVNPYIRSHVFESVKKCKDNGTKHIICFFHWNYELELYPSPYDRKLSMQLIDMGVDVVIGCHAHRVQPIEFYKGKPIVYGLGNFLFCQGYYFGGKLCFP